MRIHIQTKYLPLGEYELVFAAYLNNRVAIFINDLFGVNEMTCTCNLPDVHGIDASNVLIKDWSENKGIYLALVHADIILPAIGSIPTGFYQALLCPLSPKSLGILADRSSSVKLG